MNTIASLVSVMIFASAMAPQANPAERAQQRGVVRSEFIYERAPFA